MMVSRTLIGTTALNSLRLEFGGICKKGASDVSCDQNPRYV